MSILTCVVYVNIELRHVQNVSTDLCYVQHNRTELRYVENVNIELCYVQYDNIELRVECQC
jgi:hypothetical protein